MQNHPKKPLVRFKKEFGFSTTEERSRIMKKIRSNNTKPEITLRKELWSRGVRYRLNVKKLAGTPDIVINKTKVVIFIDGEFWHGYQWEHKKGRIKSNRDFWIPKIERNMERDVEVNRKLTDDGYKVFRFWEHQINKELDRCVESILQFALNKN
jgi:DNA mismatch endonuclease (patch repair protein)